MRRLADTKKKTPKWTIARRVVQVAALVLFCLPLAFAGWGLFGQFAGDEFASPTPADGFFYGSLSASQLGGVDILDPFAALEAMAAARAFDAGIAVGLLPVLVVYGLVRGRAFCGWVCPLGLLLELVDWVRAKLGIEVRERAVPRHAKMWVALGVVVLSAVVAIPVFEAFSPISPINKGILFGSLSGVFTLVAVVIAELFWSRRVWCRSLCPLGGFYEAIGRCGQVNVKMDYNKCIHCDGCTKACLADPVILKPVLADEDAIVRAGDCMACGKCIDACPTGALRMGLGRMGRTGHAGRESGSDDGAAHAEDEKKPMQDTVIVEAEGSGSAG